VEAINKSKYQKTKDPAGSQGQLKLWTRGLLSYQNYQISLVLAISARRMS